MKRQKFHVLVSMLALAAVGVLNPAPASAGFIYSNDFQGVVGPEWSSSSTDTTPVGARRFLGQFGNNTVSLTLTGLAPHSSLTIAFDLFLIRSWDGSDTSPSPLPPFVAGPDVFTLDVSGGPNLLRTTFSNNDVVAQRQAYPGAFPGGDFPARTGAAENNTLGYTFDYGSLGVRSADSVYRLSFTTPHSANSVTFTFAASGLEHLTNESWGLDNVVVSDNNVAAVPEPASFTMLGLGMIGILVYGRRQRKSSTPAVESRA